MFLVEMINKYQSHLFFVTCFVQNTKCSGMEDARKAVLGKGGAVESVEKMPMTVHKNGQAS